MSKTIFIVEDDLWILESMTLLLLDAGYSVHSTHDGTLAFEKIIKSKPDLILLDMLLSGIHGGDICNKLKNDEKTKSIPIIIVSADYEAKNMFKSCGANDLLTKPFQARDLLNLVKKYST